MGTKRILILIAVALAFVLADLSIWVTFTRRCLPDTSEGMQAKSIELDKYLPFDENSEIVNVKADLQLTDDLPIIDGAAALYPVFSAFVNACYPEDSVSFDGTDFTSDSLLKMTNTRSAYQAVVDGGADIVICAKPSAEQLQYAADHGVELELVPIGREAFVFLVNAKNPVDNLTVEQIKGIYTGEYTNWSDLGGENVSISPLQRNEGSGSQTAFLSFMGNADLKKPYNNFFGSAIGFSFRYYVEDVVESGNIKMLSVNGVYPSKENIANESYPIVSNFYAVYRKDNENPNVPILIQWMLSDEGQRIIEETGYSSVKTIE